MQYSSLLEVVEDIGAFVPRSLARLGLAQAVNLTELRPWFLHIELPNGTQLARVIIVASSSWPNCVIEVAVNSRQVLRLEHT